MTLTLGQGYGHVNQNFAALRRAPSAVHEGERLERRERVAADRAGAPGVSAVAALPDLPVGEAGEQAAVGGDERVRHRRERLGEPAGECRPRLVGTATVDERLRVAATVG